jgi:hypothetical protein
VRKLQVEQVRNSLANKCQNLSEAKGAKAAAELLLKIANDQKASTKSSLKNQTIVKTLFTLTLTFRFLKSLIKTK